jgi:UDP-hydrolysing UDP-N-acetyl-D-glucosamine 2-epimerase
MGENKEYIFNTGCPSIDIAKEVLDSTELDFDPFEKYPGVGSKFNYKKEYLVVMQHPVTTEYSKAREQMTNLLSVIYKLNFPTFWFWPNVDAGADGSSSAIRKFREKNDLNNMYFMKNMASNDFLKLLYNSKVLVGNSSVGIRECSFLGVPVVNIGSRQFGRQRGRNVIDTGYGPNDISKSIKVQLQKKKKYQDFIFGKGNSGKKIAEILSKVNLRSHKTLTY